MSSSLARPAARRRRCFTTAAVHEERGRDLFLAQALVAQRLEGAELVERVQRRALDVLGEAILLGDAAVAHDARHGRGLGQALLLDQQFQRPEAPAAGRHLEHAGLVALGVEDRRGR